MKHWLAALLLLISCDADAQTGSPKTTAALNVEVNTFWLNNATGLIVPFNARQTLLDFIASYGNVGTQSVTNGTSNGLLYNNGGLLGNLATAANSALVTDGSGVPSISQTLANGMKAVTQGAGDNTTRVATDQFVQSAQPALSPLAFGATCNGVADDTTAIAAAAAVINANGGGALVFPSQPFNCVIASGPIVFTTGNLAVYGANPGATVLSKMTSGDTFQFTGMFGLVSVHDLQANMVGIATSGTYFNFSNTGPDSGLNWVENVFMQNPFDAFLFQGGANVFMRATSIAGSRGTNIHFGPSFCCGAFLSAMSVNDPLSTFGLLVEGSTTGVYVSDSYFLSATCVQFKPAAGKTQSDNYFSNTQADGCGAGGGWVFDGSNAGSVLKRFTFNGVWGQASGVGFTIKNATNMAFTNVDAAASGGIGMLLTGTTSYVSITNSRVQANGQSASGTLSGIRIDTGVSNVSILGNRLGPADIAINSQKYGLDISAAGNSNITVINNDVNGNGTAGINNASTATNNRIVDNPGFNPVGTTAAANVCASPCTITAGPSPETHYLRQNGTNTATVTKGGQQVATLAAATTYYQFDLFPNESIVVTWATTTPTDTKDVH